MNLLKETEVAYSLEETETQRIINSLNEIKKIRNLEFNDDEETKSEKEQAENGKFKTYSQSTRQE